MGTRTETGMGTRTGTGTGTRTGTGTGTGTGMGQKDNDWVRDIKEEQGQGHGHIANCWTHTLGYWYYRLLLDSEFSTSTWSTLDEV